MNVFPSRLRAILAESILLLLFETEQKVAKGKDLTPSKAVKMDSDCETFRMMEENWLCSLVFGLGCVFGFFYPWWVISM